MRITIVVDNTADAGSALATEHGFSLWIETAGLRILFDTGQGSALVPNAAALGVDLGATEHLVLSHGHYDHTGAVPAALAAAPGAHVWAHPAVHLERYSVRDGAAEPIHPPRPVIRLLDSLPRDRMHWVTAPCLLAPGCGISGPVPRVTAFEDVGGPYFLDTPGRRPDPIDDDLALWFATPSGLVICCGCAHAGVVNTLGHIAKTSGITRVHALIGGFHLVHADATRIGRTLDALRKYAPDLIVPCHCTGSAAMDALQSAFGTRMIAGGAGHTFTF
ncbi:MBL fold metallo-hydrolase [bacterium]|nr:MBL fold metallo-hydrolase [bacterium]